MIWLFLFIFKIINRILTERTVAVYIFIKQCWRNYCNWYNNGCSSRYSSRYNIQWRYISSIFIKKYTIWYRIKYYTGNSSYNSRYKCRYNSSENRCWINMLLDLNEWILIKSGMFFNFFVLFVLFVCVLVY